MTPQVQQFDPLKSQQNGSYHHEDTMQAEYDETADQECAEFQALMPERIGAGEDLQTYPHMLTCERCRALVRDLEYIAQAAREFFPAEEVEPRDELWERLQAQLAIERGEA
jgi:hypothetical protein